MKTLLGIVTYGNLPFTKLAIAELLRTVNRELDIFVIVGKPDDTETQAWLFEQDIPHLMHATNRGFAASINDIYDFAWAFRAPSPLLGKYVHRREMRAPYDNVIIMGNDVIPYPRSIDLMIAFAETADWEWICSSQFDVKSLVERYPETRYCFSGETLNFNNFGARPWDAHLHQVENEVLRIEENCIKDVRNLSLFKRSVFEKIGYADVNFWAGGYFEDNDYCTRGRLAGIKGCGLTASAYFHFWSRTIHQGGKGEEHHRQFRNNSAYYEAKWGGGFEREAWSLPFNGKYFTLKDGVHLPGSLNITSRENEEEIIQHWAARGTK